MVEQFEWYEERMKGLGDAFLTEVRSVLQQIEENPLRHSPIYKETRRALVRRFPFKVFYLLEAERVEIIAVVHARRDPQHWQRRVSQK